MAHYGAEWAIYTIALPHISSLDFMELSRGVTRTRVTICKLHCHYDFREVYFLPTKLSRMECSLMSNTMFLLPLQVIKSQHNNFTTQKQEVVVLQYMCLEKVRSVVTDCQCLSLCCELSLTHVADLRSVSSAFNEFLDARTEV